MTARASQQTTEGRAETNEPEKPITVNTSVLQSSTRNSTAGRCGKPEREHIFGDECIALSEIAMDVRKQFIQRREIQKITRKTFGGLLTDVHTNHSS